MIRVCGIGGYVCVGVWLDVHVCVGGWVCVWGGRCVRRGGSQCSLCVGVVCQGEYFRKVM